MANIITLLRLPLLLLYLLAIYSGNPAFQFGSIPILVIIFFMDSVDGYVARRRGEATLMGSVLDIATDRALEIILWVVFMDLRLIPLVIPVIAIVRGTMVDAVRAVGMSKGVAAFDQVQQPISRFLVSSPLMRQLFAVVKMLAFALLTLTLALQASGSSDASIAERVALILSWTAIGMSILRGLPVLIEAFPLFRAPGRS